MPPPLPSTLLEGDAKAMEKGVAIHPSKKKKQHRWRRSRATFAGQDNVKAQLSTVELLLPFFLFFISRLFLMARGNVGYIYLEVFFLILFFTFVLLEAGMAGRVANELRYCRAEDGGIRER